MNRHFPFFRDVGDLIGRVATLLGDRRVRSRVIGLLGRSRRAQTVVAVVVSSIAALSVVRAFAAAGDARSAWTGTERVYVLVDSVADGDEITPAAVQEILLPPALAPDGRVSELRPGMRARIALPAKVVLVAEMLDTPVVWPESWRIVALPTSTAMPPVSPGDVVDVIGGTEMIVESAVVASVSPFTLAVPSERAPDVAAAVRIGEVSILAR